MKNKHLILLALILILAIALRVYGLDRQPYWMDEALSIHDSTFSSFPQFIQQIKVNEPVAPFYFFILHYWLKIGISEFSTRFLSLIFSVISIILLYLSVNKISNKRVALFSCLIFAVSFVEIVFAQETRYYSLFTLLCLASTFLFIEISEVKNKHLLLLYLIVTGLAIYTSYFGFMLLGLHFSVFLFSKKYAKNLNSFILVDILILLLFLPWLPIFLHQFSQWQQLTIDIYLLNGIPEVIARLGLFLLMVPITFCLLFLLGVAILNKKNSVLIKIKRINNKHPAILFYFLLLLFVFSSPLLIQSKVIVRYFIFLTPIAYFLLSYNLLKLRKKTLAVIVLLILVIASFSVYYTKTTKAEWPQALDFIRQNQEAGNGVLILEEGANIWITEIYDSNAMSVLPLWQDQNISLQKFKSDLSRQDYAWLALSRNWRRGNYYKALMDSLFGLPKIEKDFYDIRLYLYELKHS